MENQDGRIYTVTCKRDSQWEAAVQHREFSLVVCDDLEGWDWGSEGKVQEGGDGYIYTIHFVVQQTLTQL